MYTTVTAEYGGVSCAVELFQEHGTMAFALLDGARVGRNLPRTWLPSNFTNSERPTISQPHVITAHGAAECTDTHGELLGTGGCRSMCRGVDNRDGVVGPKQIRGKKRHIIG